MRRPPSLGCRGCAPLTCFFNHWVFKESSVNLAPDFGFGTGEGIFKSSTMKIRDVHPKEP